MTAQPPIMGDADAVREWFGISKRTLYRWSRQYADFPIVRIGGIVRYDFADLRQWLKDRRSNDGDDDD